MFQKATRKKAKLRLAISGPSGSGKTYGALQIAAGLGERIAVIDTERGSASLYAPVTDFDVLELDPPYSPERFIEAIRGAEQAGYGTLIIDSATHEWNGIGGCLEMVDQYATAKFKGNTWSAWNEVTPRHRAFVDAMLRSPMHVIVTMRSKTETAQVEEGGKKKVVKLGMKAEQRDGTEYEFTVVLDLTHDGHYALASKDRTGLFADPEIITPRTGARLLAWLETGEEAEVAHAKKVREYIEAAGIAPDSPALQALFSEAQAYCKARNDRVSHDRIKDAVKARLAEVNKTPETPEGAAA